jgi:phosphoenolpyruvate carboxykinase (GTP)
MAAVAGINRVRIETAIPSMSNSEAENDVANWPSEVLAFVDRARDLCKPDRVHLCDGSSAENQRLLDVLVKEGTIQKLNPELRPGCYAARSDPADVARSMGDTYICSEKKSDAGPTNNWHDASEMKDKLKANFSGCMQGRTMYVVPFCMGPVNSPASKFCVQITDSPYVVVSLRIMTRMGRKALKLLDGTDYIELWHSVGCPLTGKDDELPQARSSWPCNIPQRKIVQFPDTREVWSFGSGYGGNALLGKKCVALRIASAQARDEGWLAEHMLILGITNPEGEKRYICAAFPSACGKTNLAMLTPSLPGWKVETIGDDIAWLRFGKDGRMRAINPENGFFGVAPGTSEETNAGAMQTIATNSIFTNVGVTSDGDVYWEGMESIPDAEITDWKGNAPWKPTLKANGKVDTKKNPAAHPNSRFTAPLSQCPCLDPAWDSPEGVPIDAIIFGGRRDDTQPLVYESFGWDHGVFLGATMRSNATKAADQKGLVHDPMAMLPFIGYNIKDYFANWLRMAPLAEEKAEDGAAVSMPKVFHVNWFGKGDDGEFLWPGFSENCRVLEWVLNRCDGRVDARETPIGFVPTADGLNLEGLEDVDEATMERLLTVDASLWKAEAAEIRSYFSKTLMKGDDKPIPAALVSQLEKLENRIASMV